jgi:hypothetical protein
MLVLAVFPIDVFLGGNIAPEYTFDSRELPNVMSREAHSAKLK